jgi:hypothetical protein
MTENRRKGAGKAGWIAATLALACLLFPLPAHAQWCAYEGPTYSYVPCNKDMASLPPTKPACDPTKAVTGSGPECCFMSSMDLSASVAVNVYKGTCVGNSLLGCCAEASASAEAGASAFKGKAELCLKTCGFSGAAGFSIDPSYSWGYSLSATAECHWPDIPMGLGCDSAESAQNALEWFANAAVQDLNFMAAELTKFIDLDVNRAATSEILTRLTEFDKNLYPPLNKWWDNPVDHEPPTDAKDPLSGDVSCDGVLTTDQKDDLKTTFDDYYTTAWNTGTRTFDTTKLPAAWWTPKRHCTSTFPALKAMMTQIGMTKVLQVMHIGMMLDARSINEKLRQRQQLDNAAPKRFVPSEMACRVGDVGGGQTKAFELSRSMTYIITKEDTLRRQNHIDLQPQTVADSSSEGGFFIRKAHAASAPQTISKSVMQPVIGGSAQELATMWDEFIKRFCDPSRGDQGCDTATPAIYPGMNTNLPGWLWEDDQTVDINAQDAAGKSETLKNAVAALRTLIDPFAPPPIPPEALETVEGREELMRRRARDARLNTIYNVMTQMFSERLGGSGIDLDDPVSGGIRALVGLPLNPGAAVVPAANTVDGKPGGGASYAALREAMSKTQYFDPLYAVRLVNTPSAVERDQNAVDATIAQTTNDWYKRMEEMVFMEASMLGQDLDDAEPSFSEHEESSPGG